MTEVRRLGALGVILTLAAILTSPLIWGSSDKEGGRDSGTRPARTGTSDVDALMAKTKFTDQQVVTYETRDKETVFGWQVKAKAEAQARPRDIAVVIDTSASQAKGPLAGSLLLLDALAKQMGEKDRLSVWTSNLEAKNVTRGFVEKPKIEAALKPLKEEYPAGAANLKKVLPQVVKGFENERGRQRLILFLGDGMSVAGPLDDDDRAALCDAMVKIEVAFFPVPLGQRLDPINLHTLASGTGGLPLRIKVNEKPEDTARRMLTAIDLPIFYPTSYKAGGEVKEIYPTRLPPLRTDIPTLVVGKVKTVGKVTLAVEGSVADKAVRFELEQTLPEPVADNFFLAGMFNQWKELKDRPALLQADRALAFAYEENHLAHCELVALAETALEQNKLEEATKLAEQALALHPASTDAPPVLRVIKQLQDGKITRQKLLEQIRPKEKDRVVLIDNKGIRKTPVSRERLKELAAREEPEPGPMGGQPPGGGNNDPEFIREVKQRQAIEDQRTGDIVNEEIRLANRILRENPDEAYERIKRALDNVRDNPDISPRARQTLADRLRDALRSAQVQGATIKRDLADRARAEAGRVAAASKEQAQRDTEARVAARMKTLNAMLDQARLEIILSGDLRDRQAAIEAVDQLRKDVLADGMNPPQALRAAYHIAQADFHVTEARELERRRQRSWLMVLLSVEHSHIPFSDEPPIHFPPRATWRKLTEQRKAKYESSSLGADSSDRELKRLLRVLSSPQTFDALEDPTITLELFLNSLSTKMSRPDDQPPFYLTFEVNEAAFKAEQVMDVLAQPIAEKKIPKMVNVSLSAYLRRVLERINVPSKAVYVIRRDVDLPLQFSIDPTTTPPPRYIVEITTGQFAVAEKAIRVYPVADLVIPIPNSVNQQSLQNQVALFGAVQNAGLAGLPIGGFPIGGFPLGGNIGGFPIGGQGGLVGGAAAGINGQLGVAGVQGNLQGQNFGVGGGQLGFGGGQLGQFGNFGGQFGLQGGDTSQILMTMITQVVGSPRDWAPPIQFPGGMQDPNLPADDPNANLEGNQLGYYPPALALVVKGTSRIHTRVRPPSVGGGGGGAGALGAAPAPLREGVVVIGGPGMPERGKKDDKGVAQKPDPKKDPAKDPKKDLDPRKVWQDALAQGTTEPGLIVATADFLIEHRKFDHAAEFLKANLRQGVVVRPWVYESLALVLREANASTDEVERAEVSATDLEPQDAQGYLNSAKAMAELKRYDRALAFCRQAAQLEPNLPDCYADALSYAELSQDPVAMSWAAGALLEQDWPFRNSDLHEEAATKLQSLSKVIEKDRAEEAAKLKGVAKARQRRDLVIKGSWQGNADLDLRVAEPSGSTCTAVTRQTVGGGAMTGDVLGEDNTETYVAAEAFPGKYTITVERAWGKSVGDKCQLQIITHQGTDKEHVKLVTVELDKSPVVTFNLEEGRRKELAIVPAVEPPSPMMVSEGSGIDKIFGRLRSLTEEDMPRGLAGGAGSTIGSPIEQAKLLQAAEQRGVPRRFQNRVSPYTSVSNSSNLSVQATVSPDRRSVRLSMNAMFSGATGTQLRPYVSSSVLPGGQRP